MLKNAYPVEAPDHDAALMAMRGPFEPNIAALKEMGYEAVELLVRDPAALDRTNCEEILKKYGMGVAALSTAPMPKADGVDLQSPETGEEAERRIRDMIALAARWNGCPISIGKARGSRNGGDLSGLKERLSRLDIHAARAHVTLALEPQSRTNIDSLNTVREAEALIDGIGGKSLGLHLDTYHMDIEEKDAPGAIAACRYPIAFVHMADRERRVPGTGGIDWQALLHALKQKGFTGWLSPEIKQGNDSRETARQFMAWAQTQEGI